MERGSDQTDDRTAAAAEAVTSASDAQADHLWAQRHQVLYRCQLSTRYHRRRERFFDWMDRATNAVALIAGSAAFAGAANPQSVQIAAVAVTGAAAFSLVFGFADKARRHSALAEGYKRTEADVFRAGDYDFTEAQLNGWRARIAEIEAGEPPALRPLVVLCQNDIAVAANQMKLVTKLPLHHRLLAHFVDFDVLDKKDSLAAT